MDDQKTETMPPFDEFENGKKEAVAAMDAAEKAVKELNKDNVTEIRKPNNGDKMPMAIEKGGLSPKTFDELWKMASLYFKAAVAPRKAGFDSTEKVAAALEYCNKMGLVFQSAVGNMVWINDRLSIWGELPTAICQKSGQLEQFDTVSVDSEYNEICLKNKNLEKDPMAFITTIKRKGKPVKEYTYTKKDAERAQLLNKDIWKLHWPIMMRRKCRGLALKMEMADLLLGIGIAEYDFDTSPDLRDVTPERPSTANYISDKYAKDVSPDVAPQLPSGEAEKPTGEVLPL